MENVVDNTGAQAPEEENVTDVETGLEAVIAKQDPNDSIIKDTMAILDSLAEFYKDPNIRITNSDDKIQDALEDLSKVYTKRFGAKFKFDTDTSLLSVSEVGPMSDTGLSDIKSFIESLRKDYKEEELMAHPVFVNYVNADKYMRDNPVVVDLEKAYFRQWPKGTTAMVHINLAAIIGVLVLGRKYTTVVDCIDPLIANAQKDGYLMSTKALTAIILHEVGHIFSFYTYQHLTRSVRCVFEDTLKDQIRKGNNPKSALYIAYQSAYSKSSHKVKPTDGMSKILVNIVRSEGERYGFTNNKSSSSDTEFVADQFVTRFGLGAENADALAALIKYNIRIGKYNRTGIITGIGLWVIWALITTGEAITLNAMSLVGLTVSSLFALFPIVMVSLVSFIANKSAELTYDPDVRRLERIRLDVIRQLRLHGNVLPKKEVEKLLKDADDIKVIIDDISKLSVSRFKFISGIVEYIGNAKKEDDLDKYLEETMENELHLAALRFK